MSADLLVQPESDAPELVQERTLFEPSKAALDAELDNIFLHPEEVLVSFSPAELTEIRRGAFNRWAEAVDKIHHVESRPYIDLQAKEIEQLEREKALLVVELERLQQEQEAQDHRIEQLTFDRRALLSIVSDHETETLEKAMESPTDYMRTALEGLSVLYERRSIFREHHNESQLGQRFALLSEQQPPQLIDGKLSPVPRKADINVSLSFKATEADAQADLAFFQVTTDLGGKLEYPHSLSLSPNSPIDPKTGERKMQVMKHGWERGRPIMVEVTDEVQQLVFFQAIVSDLYYRVYDYSVGDDEEAKDLVRRH